MIDQQCDRRRIAEAIVINTMHAFFQEGVHGTTLNNNEDVSKLMMDCQQLRQVIGRLSVLLVENDVHVCRSWQAYVGCLLLLFGWRLLFR